MSYTRKRTSNTATFLSAQNSARKKNAKEDIKELKGEISNLKQKQAKYERIINKYIIKHGLAKAHKETEFEHKNKMKCIDLIQKKKEKIVSLEKSLSRTKDLRGGYGYSRSKNSRKSKKKNHK